MNGLTFLHSHTYNKVIKEALTLKILVIFSPKKITSTPINFKVVLSPYNIGEKSCLENTLIFGKTSQLQNNNSF
jgi:hypothetical protein